MKKKKFDVEKPSHVGIKHGLVRKKECGVGKASHVAVKPRSSTGVANDPVLESKHKIFLSHSGVQKEFVDHLCQALEARCRYPFFDRRHESLPKGKQFPRLIVKAAQQCHLLVVVVSEEYFMSKWPMIELNEFVQATKVLKSNVNAAILPLFYELYVSDVKDKERQQRWLKQWKKFAKDDSVEGRIKVLFDKMKPVGLSQMYKVKVVGIYGEGGIGKTTTCNIFCNNLSNEYEGRVCHVEFDNTCLNSKELLQNAIIKLTRHNVDFVHRLSEGECKHVLHMNLSKQRTFLALDNVSDIDNSIKQAQMFLDFPSHIDSLVLVTTRSQSILALKLRIDEDACFEMPKLDELDAINVFLFYATPGEHFTTKEDMDHIKCCIKKGDGRGYHYNPSELEALGRQLRGSKEKPIEWVKHLPHLSIQPIQPKEEDLGVHLQVDYPPPINTITRLEEMEEEQLSNVLVLQLYGLNSIDQNLNLEGLTCLRNLQVYKFQFSESLEGLKLLKHLTCFERKTPYFSSGVLIETHIVGEFPTSLKHLYILGPSMLSGFNVLAHFNNLIKLWLGSVEIGALLDLSYCSSSETTKIYDIVSLQAFSLSTIASSSRLYTLDIWGNNGIHIPRLDRLDGLVQLVEVKRFDTTWEVPCLLSLTKKQKLRINTHAKPTKQCIVRQLQELFYDICKRHEAFKQLQVLDLSWSHSMTKMDGMDGLPTLQSLNLYHCVFLERLPDLSKSKSLRDLNLKGCIGLQLYVEDFETLARLPLLRLVLFSNKSKQKKNKLDTNGKKVLQYLGPIFDVENSWLAWKEGELEELEFAHLPVKLGNPSHSDPQISIESDIEELEIIESNMEELNGVDSNMDNIVFDTENILKTYDIRQMTQGNSDLGILRSPFNCSALFWFVVDYIKQFGIAKIFI